MPSRRNPGAAWAVILSVLAAGCRPSAHGEAPEPGTFVVLLDRSKASPATTGFCQAVVAYAADRATAVPGSVVEVVTLGADVASTRTLATFPFAGSRRTGAAAVASAKRKYRETVLAEAGQLLAETWPATPPRTTPVAAALTRIGRRLQGVENAVVIAGTDGREMTNASADGPGYDGECGSLDPGRFTRYLARHGYLTAGSLEGVTVELYGLDSAPIDLNRCPVTLLREAQLDANWRSALLAAGAMQVVIAPTIPRRAGSKGGA